MSTSPEYYARRAREYERIYTKPERQEDLAELRGYVAEKFSGEHVLEVACGTGYWTEVMANRAAGITALDINEEVLSIARAKPGNAGVNFLRLDAFRLPRLAEKFTAALAVFWWSHLRKREIPGFLAGLHAQLQPGAKIMFIDNCYVPGSSTEISRKDADGNTYQRRKLDDGSEHEVLKNFPSEAELKGAVSTVGSQCAVRLLRHYWVLEYEAR